MIFAYVLSFHLFAADFNFSHLNFPKAQDFVKIYMIEKIQDDFVIFLSGLAGVAAFRYLLRF